MVGSGGVVECEKGGGGGGDTGDVNTLCARGVAAARALINTRPASGQRRSLTNCCHRRKLSLSLHVQSNGLHQAGPLL